MKTDPKCAVLLLIIALGMTVAIPSLHAGPRSSASYSIAAETTDGGGQLAASATYTHEGSAGSVAGVSTAALPFEIAKSGFLGQLFEIAGLVVNASAVAVNEAGALQLGAWQLLDDATYLAVDPDLVSWAVVGGPLMDISAEGLATAGLVFQNTPATVQGTFAGFTGVLDLPVLDSIADNFGSYAGDELHDAWQHQYFGLDNPLAAPAADPDGDGNDNRFEFVAGLIPIDADSRFRLAISAVPGEPHHRAITFSPRFDDRIYVVTFKLDLTAAIWMPLADSISADDGPERTVTDRAATDRAATDATRFYHVEITKP